MKDITTTDHQTKIWNHFQNNDIQKFSGNIPRLSYLLKKAMALKPAKKGIHFLNVGAGNAYLEKIALSAGYDTYSLDLSSDTVKKLIAEGINAFEGSLVKTPFHDQQFDIVIATEVLEHLSDSDLNSSLSEIKRILKPDGYFIGTIPYAENLSDNTVYCPHCQLEFHRWGHLQSFSIESIRRLLKQSFSIIEIYPRSFIDWRLNSLKKRFKNLIRYLLARLGFTIAQPNIFFVCKR